MRFTRSLLAGLGAATSLVAAGSFALLTVSAVVAFQGWPGVSGVSLKTETTALVAAAPSSGQRPADRRLRMAALAPRRRAASAVESDRVVAPRGAPVALSGPARQRATRPSGGAQPAAPVAAPKPDGDPPALGRAGDGVRDTTAGLGKTSSGTTDSLGDAVAPVSPGLDKALDEVGGIVDKTLRDVGGALGSVLDGGAGR